MKKIMIYSGKGNIRSADLRQNIKKNADVILLFTAFACGLLTGSIILKSLYSDRIFSVNGEILFSDTGGYLLRAGIYSSALVISAYFGALSCFGIILQVANGLFFGGVTGALFSFILMNHANGVINRSFVCMLPGTVLFTCAFLLYSADCIKISGKLCLNFFFQKNEKSDLRIFTIKTLMVIACMGIGLLINALLLTMFT